MTQTLPQVWGPRIRRLRLAHDLTQAELGALVGCTGAAVNQWEAGSRGPRTAVLPFVATALGITVDELIKSTPDDESVAP